MRFLIYVVSTMPNSTRRASSPCPGSGTLAPTMTLSRRRVLAGIPTTLALAAAGRHAGAVVVPESTWRRRYGQIEAFEQMLAAEGTMILKFFLHISKDEQRARLEARVEDPTKRWKFQPEDVEERRFWAEYRRAYEDALSKTSTEQAPWYIVPANQKWYRNYVVGSVIADALAALDMKYPEPDLSGVVIN